MHILEAGKETCSLNFLREGDTTGSMDCLRPTDGPESSSIRRSVKVHHNDLRTELIHHPQVLEDARVIGEKQNWLRDVSNLAPLTPLVAFL